MIPRTRLFKRIDCWFDHILWRVMRPTLELVWDEGFDAGHETARAVNPEYPNPTPNPFREKVRDEQV